MGYREVSFSSSPYQAKTPVSFLQIVCLYSIWLERVLVTRKAHIVLPFLFVYQISSFNNLIIKKIDVIQLKIKILISLEFHN